MFFIQYIVEQIVIPLSVTVIGGITVEILANVIKKKRDVGLSPAMS